MKDIVDSTDADTSSSSTVPSDVIMKNDCPGSGAPDANVPGAGVAGGDRVDGQVPGPRAGGGVAPCASVAPEGQDARFTRSVPNTQAPHVTRTDIRNQPYNLRPRRVRFADI